MRSTFRARGASSHPPPSPRRNGAQCTRQKSDSTVTLRAPPLELFGRLEVHSGLAATSFLSSSLGVSGRNGGLIGRSGGLSGRSCGLIGRAWPLPRAAAALVASGGGMESSAVAAAAAAGVGGGWEVEEGGGEGLARGEAGTGERVGEFCSEKETRLPVSSETVESAG